MSEQPQLFRQALGGLGTIVGSSLFRNAVRNWWITAPLGYAAYTLIRERQKKNQLTVPNVVNDLVPMVTMVAALVTLNHILSQQDGASASIAAPKQPLGPIRDASFTPSSKPGPLPGLPVGT